MTTCISAQHVRKSYGDSVALSDVSFELKQGEIVALLGPNGAGKTTFVKILATLLSKDGGDVQILGYDLDRHEREVRHLFGYVGQDTDRSAYPRLTAAQNLRFFGALRGLNRRQCDAQIDKLATYFDFQDQLSKEFMQLSGGQKQTVVVMRALLHDPLIVYLDEPTKGLDLLAAKRLRSFLRDYVYGERKSILLTTHILTEVEDLASRVALMHAGKIGIADSPEGLKSAVGATEFVEILTEDLPHATRQKILNLQSVLFVLDADPHWTAFAVSDPFDGAEAILRTLREDGAVAKFRLRSVSLEDAFVHHMGVLNNDKFD
ncbi:MAG: ABC transporter ATP-binding protein [Chloroflexota bacterium]|nr:ABC transporter ATP-binding protein [Chloroflexota bacterium]